MKPIVTLFALTLTILLMSAGLFADTVYVRDTLYVPLRGGESPAHRILHRGLRSGTELERLEENDETGYSRVRTEDGLEGWLQTQYLVTSPSASTQLEEMKSELDELETNHQQTLLSLQESTDLNDSLAEAEGSTAQKNIELTEELTAIMELASNVIAIDDENKQLNKSQEALLAEINLLNEANESLNDDRAQEWFLRGAGTILIGLLFGFWIGRRIYHKRNTGGWA